MKKINIISILILAIIMMSCDKKPIESEQFKKMVYLVGAQNPTQQLILDYSETEVSTFVSVATSGSLNIDRDVHVRLSSPSQIVHDYNNKFFEDDQVDLFLKPLSSSKYRFPDMENLVIRSSDGVYGRQPLFVQTADLHPDSVYAIAVGIDHVSDYTINPNLDQLILTLKLKNKFSGNYSMTGKRKNLTSNATTVLQKNKVLTATGINKLRMYIGDNSENISTRNSETILLEIQADNSVKITSWNSLKVLNGTGVYNPLTKTLDVNYTYSINNISYQVNEVLTLL